MATSTRTVVLTLQDDEVDLVLEVLSAAHAIAKAALTDDLERAVALADIISALEG